MVPAEDRAFWAIQSVGVWHTATEAILPTNAASDPRVKLTRGVLRIRGQLHRHRGLHRQLRPYPGLGFDRDGGHRARGVGSSPPRVCERQR